MAKEVKLKCLRCGYEYTTPVSENLELEERTSTSIQRVFAHMYPSDATTTNIRPAINNGFRPLLSDSRPIKGAITTLVPEYTANKTPIQMPVTPICST